MDHVLLLIEGLVMFFCGLFIYVYAASAIIERIEKDNMTKKRIKSL